MTECRVAYYGDDFTGSVDVLLQFARSGWRGCLFTALPDADTLARAAATHDVVGVAGVARSLPRAGLDTEVEPVLRAFAAVGPRIIQYKVCSTADSSPDIGSIGRVVEIARRIVGPAPVPALFAQPDFGRYTVFGTHFAAEGGTVYRLDRQPTMSRHPSTPMTEADLARHLSAQTDLPVGSIPFTAYGDAGALHDRICDSACALVVLDAADARQADLVGAAVSMLAAPAFAVGSGGLSAALGHAHPGTAGPVPRVPAEAATGPVLAVSGSRSAATQRQIDAARAAGWSTEPLAVEDIASQAARVVHSLRAGRSVALGSDGVAAGDGDRAIAVIAQAAATVVHEALAAGATRRVIVCGGDTSGRVTRHLGVRSLSIAANPRANVVVCRAHADDATVDGAELLLKGGQVGDDDLFEQIRTRA